MSPLQPHWQQPSHPDVQEVITNEADFMTKSYSKVALPPFGLFAKLNFPPCDLASEPTYATVQMGKDKHLNLNSDLLYINHSCEPSLFFDMGNMNIVAGPKGLQPGDELTFFYPSTEWDMAQPFDCLCGKPTCRKVIAGAKSMSLQQLEGLWLNGHIHDLLREQANNGQSQSENGSDPTAQALKHALELAEKAAEAARLALRKYTTELAPANGGQTKKFNGGGLTGGLNGKGSGLERRGPTSRELSGEMGGDTICV